MDTTLVLSSSLTFIKKAYSENTGGGVMVDVLIMEDGTTITVTEDCLVTWGCVDDFYNNECEAGIDTVNFDAVKLRSVTDKAMAVFWSAVAESYPGIKTGDLAPDQQLKFEEACAEVVNAWKRENLVI